VARLGRLMKRLGYTRYVAQGGDWGAFVVDQMGLQAPEGLLAIHTNMPATVPPDVDRATLAGEPVSASRLYWEYKGGFFNAKGVSIPVAVTVFPSEQYRAPRSWAERAYPNLIYFNEVDRGGHFAAWEQPELFSDELRKAFRSLRP
jgi:pimeloyl-ACP methyl ester carboxylesterase